MINVMVSDSVVHFLLKLSSNTLIVCSHSTKNKVKKSARVTIEEVIARSILIDNHLTI